MVKLIGGKTDKNASPAALLETILAKSEYMPYCIAQTIEHGMGFTRTVDVSNRIQTEQILRLHVFGEGGDFTLRYDDGTYYWRFVGNCLEALPDGVLYEKPLDEGDSQSALLWGKLSDSNDPTKWHENIVGKAELTYPIDDKPERVMIHAKSVINEAGDIVAYWTYKLTQHQPETERTAS